MTRTDRMTAITVGRHVYDSLPQAIALACSAAAEHASDGAALGAVPAAAAMYGFSTTEIYNRRNRSLPPHAAVVVSAYIEEYARTAELLGARYRQPRGES